MGSLSIWHWLIVLAVILLLFGGSSKISTLMGDFAKGIKSFKKNMGEDESMEHGTTTTTPPSSIAAPTPHAASPAQPTAGYTVYPAQGTAAGTATSAPVDPVRHSG